MSDVLAILLEKLLPVWNRVMVSAVVDSRPVINEELLDPLGITSRFVIVVRIWK